VVNTTFSCAWECSFQQITVSCMCPSMTYLVITVIHVEDRCAMIQVPDVQSRCGVREREGLRSIMQWLANIQTMMWRQFLAAGTKKLVLARLHARCYLLVLFSQDYSRGSRANCIVHSVLFDMSLPPQRPSPAFHVAAIQSERRLLSSFLPI